MNDYTKEELLEKANIARRVAMTLAENIYKYVGGCITKEELKSSVDMLISHEHTIRMYHQYILKDTYGHPILYMCGTDLNEDFSEDDTDTIIIIEGDADDRSEKTT